MPELTLETDCRHIAPSDNAFTARMRFHQSWVRRHVLGLPPGPNKSAHGQETYGSVLRPEDGAAGWNFVSPAVHAFAEQRLAQDAVHIEPWRLRNNLLSSQPMCFNLFAPLALDLDLATRLLRKMPGIPQDAQVTRVELEYAPTRAEMLNDGTSFDAWVEYERADGKRGFVAIETKLTEPFSQQHYPYSPRYQRWQSEPTWWWRHGAEAHFCDKQFNQIWRNHLLAFALRHQPDGPYSECVSVVVSHPMDSACTTAIAAYREHLLPDAPANLLHWPLDDLVARWTSAAQTPDETSWLQALNQRYLDLNASEPAWLEMQQRR